MQKKCHYIAGLPRSGSTLLTGILRQNPRFFSDISDNYLNYVTAVINAGDPSTRSMLTEERLRNTIQGVFDGYFKHIDAEVIFNCNRGWPKHVEYLYQINENFRIICCVRDYNQILNSFEKIYKTRTLKETDNAIVYLNNTLTVWHRTDYLATDGSPRYHYNCLKEAYYGLYRKHMLFVEYDELTKMPRETMKRIYDFIEEPYYEHDFNDVEYSNNEYDRHLQAPGLHTIRGKVQYEEPVRVIPPDLWEKYSGWEFWRE